MAKLNLTWISFIIESIRITKTIKYTDKSDKYNNDTFKIIFHKAKKIGVSQIHIYMYSLNGKNLTDMKLIANYFNRYFMNVGSQAVD